MSEKTKMPVMPKGAYKALPGNFVIIQADGKPVVEQCRDRFQATSEPEAFREFYICHGQGKSPNVIAFMKLVEVVVGVSGEDALVLSETDNPEFTYVKMSLWWKQRVRRSLLTALLRCGHHFVEDTGKGFTDALYTEYYTKDTREAIERFLSGYSAVKMRKRDTFGGWWQLFRQAKGDPNKILVRQRRKKEEKSGSEPQQQEAHVHP